MGGHPARALRSENRARVPHSFISSLLQNENENGAESRNDGSARGGNHRISLDIKRFRRCEIIAWVATPPVLYALRTARGCPTHSSLVFYKTRTKMALNLGMMDPPAEEI